MKTPSRLQVGDDAKLNFFKSGVIENCKIRAVHFTDSKVTYDVSIFIMEEIDPNGTSIAHYTLIKDVDSAFIAPMFEAEEITTGDNSKKPTTKDVYILTDREPTGKIIVTFDKEEAESYNKNGGNFLVEIGKYHEK